jgi:hypothetical protein
VVKLSSLAVSGGSGAMYPAFTGDTLHYALYCNESPTLSIAAETEHDGAQLTLLRADSDDNAVSATGALRASVTVDEDHDLAIEVSAGGATATYVVHCLPAAFPSVNVTTTDQVKDGLLLMTPTYGGYHDRTTYLAVLDNNGVPRFHRLLTDANFWAMNLQYHGGGRFSVSRRPLLNVADSAFGNWQIDLLDDRLAVTSTVTTVSPLSQTDGHDFQIAGDEHDERYVLLSYHDDELRDFSEYGGSASQRTRDSVIQRRTAAGEPQFTWNSWDHRDVLRVGNDCRVGEYPDTYAHLNGLQLLPDGDFVASFRGCSQVLRIDGSTGAVEWKLGGTAPAADSGAEFLEMVDNPDAVEEFCGQHHVTLTAAETVVMYDNGVQCIGTRKNSAQFSRAVEYDISSGTHAVYKREYRAPDGQGYFPYRGGVHVLDTFGGKVHWLINWGGSASDRTVTVDNTIAASEVDPDTGTVHMQVTMFKDTLDAWSYRVYRVPEDALDLPLNLP